ncbi:hypothetical protein niasHT_004000 [Heterodera trifolii]|uniref:Uncharacterized protein n=1 Tax=Heterodera trifolii TaxID=157864 RepID=A0ABD2LVW1_9BILA
MYAQQNDMSVSQEEAVLPRLTAADFAAMDEAHRQREVERRQREEQQQREFENRPKWMWSDEWMARQRAWEEENEEKEKDPQNWKMEKEKHIQKWAQKNTEIWKKSLDERSSSSNNNNKQSDAAQYTWDWAKLENQEKTFLETGGLW